MDFGNVAAIGTDLLGGIFGARDAGHARDQNWAMAEKNIELQKEFAQHGIRWKAEDAVRAGLHPLAALGANTTSFSPVSVGAVADTSMQSAFSNMGQDFSRAISATRTEEERKMASLQLASAEADVQGKNLDNQIRLAQLNKLNSVGPAMPSNLDNFIPGQGDSSKLVNVKPASRTASQPGRLAQEAGWRPDVSYSRTDTGLTPMVPEALSESLEDDIVGKILWRVRNQLLPNFTGKGAPAKSQLPKGYDDWEYKLMQQEWRPVKGRAFPPFHHFNLMR